MFPIDYEQLRVELRQKIIDILNESGFTAKAIASRINMTEAVISKFLNKKQSIKLTKLDEITSALELPEGYFYRNYVGECYNTDTGKLRKEKTKEFIIRSYTVGYTDIAEQLVSELIDFSKSNMIIVYEIAEYFFAQRQYQVAKGLYQRIVSEETNTLADHYSIGYLRYFQIVRDNIGKAYEPSVRLENHAEQLPNKELKMEAYMLLAKYCYVTEDWERMSRITDLWVTLTKPDDGEMYGYSLLYKASSFHRIGNIDEAIRLTYQYETVDQKFSEIAKGNRMIYAIDQGEIELIPELIAYAKRINAVDEVFRPVLNSYLKNSMYDQFQSFLKDISLYLKPITTNDLPFTIKNYLYYHYLTAVYYVRIDENINAIPQLLSAVSLAERLEDYNFMKKCLYLFYENSAYATLEQKREVKQFVEGGDLPI
ncbi:helix-turn-helix transcriptional regulator [Brevibacillus dissolubilis]|uniref:helix-turn-helix transcriptional regulator n=1 Tax=Brevibacillus dissolubilis TaxID=1844116 RepID=UPI00111778A6|nr:helix-turn-helix transcriptional regulator [Brevibacillus dissolubilis]